MNQRHCRGRRLGRDRLRSGTVADRARSLQADRRTGEMVTEAFRSTPMRRFSENGHHRSVLRRNSVARSGWRLNTRGATVVRCNCRSTAFPQLPSRRFQSSAVRKKRVFAEGLANASYPPLCCLPGRLMDGRRAPRPTVPERSFERVGLTRRATFVPSNRMSRIVKRTLRIAAVEVTPDNYGLQVAITVRVRPHQIVRKETRGRPSRLCVHGLLSAIRQAILV